MREIVDEVLAAEQKAETLIKEAKEQAAEIRRRAETDISQQLKQARDQAQGVIRARVEEAEKQAQERYTESITDVRRTGEAHLKKDEEEMDGVVQALVHLILAPQQDQR